MVTMIEQTQEGAFLPFTRHPLFGRLRCRRAAPVCVPAGVFGDPVMMRGTWLTLPAWTSVSLLVGPDLLECSCSCKPFCIREAAASESAGRLTRLLYVPAVVPSPLSLPPKVVPPSFAFQLVTAVGIFLPVLEVYRCFTNLFHSPGVLPPICRQPASHGHRGDERGIALLLPVGAARFSSFWSHVEQDKVSLIRRPRWSPRCC